MRLPSNGLAQTVVRLVRSGQWKQLKTNKDKSVYDYLCKNLERREQMLARMLVNDELGEDTPPELKISKRVGQQTQYQVRHNQTGQIGILNSMDQDQAVVTWVGEDPSTAETTTVDIDELSFANQAELGRVRNVDLYPVGMPVKMKADPEKTGTISGYAHDFWHERGKISGTHAYRIEWDDLSPATVQTAEEIIPIWKSPDATRTEMDKYFKAGDEVVDTRYNIKGMITTVAPQSLSILFHPFTKTNLAVKYGPDSVEYIKKLTSEQAAQGGFASSIPSNWPEGGVVGNQSIGPAYIGDGGSVVHEVTNLHEPPSERKIELESESSLLLNAKSNPTDMIDKYVARNVDHSKNKKHRKRAEMFGRVLDVHGGEESDRIRPDILQVQLLDGTIVQEGLDEWRLATPVELVDIKRWFENVDMPQRAPSEYNVGDWFKYKKKLYRVEAVLNDGSLYGASYHSSGMRESHITIDPEKVERVTEEHESSWLTRGSYIYSHRSNAFEEIEDVRGNILVTSIIAPGTEMDRQQSAVDFIHNQAIPATEEQMKQVWEQAEFNVGDSVGVEIMGQSTTGVVINDKLAHRSVLDGFRPVYLVLLNGASSAVLVDPLLSLMYRVDDVYKRGELVYTKFGKQSEILNSDLNSRDDQNRLSQHLMVETEEGPQKLVIGKDAEPLVSKMIELVGGLDQFMNVEVRTDRAQLRKSPGTSSERPYSYGTKPKFIVSAEVNEKLNTVDIQTEKIGGRQVERFSLPWPEFYKMVSAKGDTREEAYRKQMEGIDSEEILGSDDEYIKYRPGSRIPVDYLPREDGTFPIEPFLNFVAENDSHNEQYEALIASNLDLAAKSFDSVLLQNALRDGDSFLALKAAMDQDRLSETEALILKGKLVDARNKMFNHLNAGTLTELFKRSNLKVQFVTALDFNINSTKEEKYVNDIHPRLSKIAAFQQILQQPEAYAGVVKNFVKVNDLGVLEFSDKLRIRRDEEGMFHNTNPRSMLGSLVSAASRVGQGTALKVIADLIPSDTPAPLKLKALINTMLGYKLDHNGELVRNEAGDAVVVMNEQGQKLRPTREEMMDKKDQAVTLRLDDALRRVGLSFDEAGFPIMERVKKVCSKYGMDPDSFFQYLEALREKEESKGNFHPNLMRALDDDEFGQPLKHIVSEATQESSDEVWRHFTNGPNSVSGEVTASAYIDGTLDYGQAIWLSGIKDFDKHLLAGISKATEKSVADIASAALKGEPIEIMAGASIPADKVMQLLASPEVIKTLTKKDVFDAILNGVYDNIELSEDALRTSTMRAVVEHFSGKVFDHITKHGLENVDDAITVKQPQIYAAIKGEWQKHATAESLRSMEIMQQPYDRRNELAKPLRDLLLTKNEEYPEEYAWVQEKKTGFADGATYEFTPMTTVFAPDGNLYKGLFRAPDEKQAEEFDRMIQNTVVGVSPGDVQYRAQAAVGGKNIARAAKEVLKLMNGALSDNEQQKELNALYIAFTGDASGSGRINDDLKTLYKQLNENGFASDSAVQALNDAMGKDFDLGRAARTASNIVGESIAMWMLKASDREINAMYKSIDKDAVDGIKTVLEKELLRQSLDSLKGKFQTPKKNAEGNIIFAEDGKPEREINFSKFKNSNQFYKALQKAGLKIEGEETVESKVGLVLQDIGLQPNIVGFKGQQNAESLVLMDQLERLQTSDKLDDFFMRLFTPTSAGDESLFKAISQIESLSQKKATDVVEQRVQLSDMMTGLFVSSLVPPRSESHQDGLAGYWPYKTIIDRNSRGSWRVKTNEVLGQEWTVQHDIDWDAFFENFDQYYAHLSVDEREHKKKVFKHVSAADNLRHHNFAPWTIFEVFDVDYVDNDGTKQTARKLATREIQYDGIQGYMDEVEHPEINELEEGDVVYVYNKKQADELLKRYNEVAKLATMTEKERAQTDEELQAELTALSRPPQLDDVVVHIDEDRNRYYEASDGSKIFIKQMAKPNFDNIQNELELQRFSENATTPGHYVGRVKTGWVERAKPDAFEQEVLNELTKVYNLVYRSLVRAAKAVEADEVLVLPSWTAKVKPLLKNWIGDSPPVDSAVTQTLKTAVQEFDPHSKMPVKDYLGNEVWTATKVSQPLKDGYDNTAKAWGFSLSDLDHYYGTDPFWGYSRQQVVSKMWKLDLTGKNKSSQEQIKRLNKRDAQRRRGLITAQHSEAGASLAVFLQTYFEIQYRSGEITFNRFADTLRDGYIQWRDMAAHQKYVHNPEVLEDAKRVASEQLGVDLTGVDAPSWAYQQIDPAAYERFVEKAQAELAGSDDKPSAVEMAAKLDQILEAVMPNMYSHPEYSHLDSLDIPTAVARDILAYDHVNFPQSAVREDPEYRRQILDGVKAFEIRQDEVLDEGVSTTWQDPVPDDGGVAGGNIAQADFYASEAASFMNKERDDSYDAFVRWMDAEAPELHANDGLRAEVEQELRNRGKLSHVPSTVDVPSADELERMFENDVREASLLFRKGDKVVVRYCVAQDPRCFALAKKRATAKVHAATNAGYILKFDGTYNQEVLNRQLWLFTDLHLQPASGVSNG